MSRREMVMRSRSAWSCLSVAIYLRRQALEFRGASNERTEIEAKGFFDLAPLPSPRVAFSVRAVATKDQAKINQTG